MARPIYGRNGIDDRVRAVDAGHHTAPQIDASAAADRCDRIIPCFRRGLFALGVDLGKI